MTASTQDLAAERLNAIPPRELEQAILRRLRARRAGASICPSEVARELAGDTTWRLFMQPVRDAASRLRERGELETLQRGRPVDPLTVRGPIRLRLPAFVSPEPYET
ncbi:MAG: DUF3253 domain-containing protein [Chromatiales bacterium]|jgi:hypothetical protein